LDVLDRVRFGFADILKAILVDVEGAFIDTGSLLPLVTLGKHWYEFRESGKLVLNFCV
jgi:hypothetical protein